MTLIDPTLVFTNCKFWFMKSVCAKGANKVTFGQTKGDIFKETRSTRLDVGMNNTVKRGLPSVRMEFDLQECCMNHKTGIKIVRYI